MADRGVLIAARDEHAYLVERLRLSAAHEGLTGRSSDAMVRHAFGGEDPIKNWDYPADRWDFRRCLLAYALAPDSVRERMRPLMCRYRAELRGQYRRWHPAKSPKLSTALREIARSG